MKKNDIHVAIAFDQNYLNQFYALYSSIVSNNSANKLYLHCIATGMSTEALQKIIHLGKQHQVKISFYNIEKETISRFVTCGSWTMAAYYRLFFPFLLPAEINRLLYIDSDALVLQDLWELYKQDLEQYPVGAVYDNYVKSQPLIGITEEGKYFNSGVLLIDIPKWKEQRISELAFEYLEQYPERIRFVDQCALNAVLKDNWMHIPMKYNCMYSYIPEGMSKSEQKQFIGDKFILHFTLQRPWHFLCKNPYRYLYRHYLGKYPGKKTNVIHDYSIKKVPALLKNRLVEFYHDSPVIKSVWRKLK